MATSEGIPTFDHGHITSTKDGTALSVVDNALEQHARTGKVNQLKYGASITAEEALIAAATALRIRDLIITNPNTTLVNQDPKYTGNGHYWLQAQTGASANRVIEELSRIMGDLIACSSYYMRCKQELLPTGATNVARLINTPSVTLMIYLNGVKLSVTFASTSISLIRDYDDAVRAQNT